MTIISTAVNELISVGHYSDENNLYLYVSVSFYQNSTSVISAAEAFGKLRPDITVHSTLEIWSRRCMSSVSYFWRLQRCLPDQHTRHTFKVRLPNIQGFHHSGDQTARRRHTLCSFAFTHLGRWRKLYDCSLHHLTTSLCVLKMCSVDIFVDL